MSILFHEIEKETFLTSFYEAIITPIPKTLQGSYRPVSHMTIDAEILNKIQANQIYKDCIKCIYTTK